MNNTSQALRKMARGAALLALSVNLLALTACNDQPERQAPPTFSVTGEVTARGDFLPVGGCVEFKPMQNEHEFTAMGVIDAQGKFSLKIPFVDRVLFGATEGPHCVRVVLPLEGNGSGGGFVPIEGTFVVRPSENQFTIAMPDQREPATSTEASF